MVILASEGALVARQRGKRSGVVQSVEHLEARTLLSFVLNHNVILNPGAGGAASATGNDVENVPNWTTSSGFTIVQYGASGFPSSTDPGPDKRGSNFFAGGPQSSFSSAYQYIDVSDGAAAIDSGKIRSRLAGWFGGWEFQDDNATLYAYFLNSAGKLLKGASAGGVLSADRSGATSLLYRATDVVVPVGTRTIEVKLAMRETSGFYNDGYADNVSLVFQDNAVPNRTVYISRFNAGDIYRVNPVSGAFSRVVGGLTDPEGLAVSPDGVLYVGGEFTGIRRVATATGLMMSAVGTNVVGPEGPVLDAAGNLYVNTRKDPAATTGIWRVPGATAATAQQIVPPFSPWGEGMAFLPTGPFSGSLIAADAAGGTSGRIVRSAPPAFGKPSTFIAGLDVPVGVAVNPLNGHVYIANVHPAGNDGSGPGDILEYDSAGTYVGAFASGLAWPTMLTFDANGNLYLCESGGDGQLVEFLPDGTEYVLLNHVGNSSGVAVQEPPRQAPGTITANQLQSIMQASGHTLDPTAAASWANAFNGGMAQYGINDSARVAAFLAQIGEETGGLIALREGGNVSEAQRIQSLLPLYGPNAKAPYRPRSDILTPGAGVKGPNYYGRGPIMLTSLGNYKAFSEYLYKSNLFRNIIASPDTLVAQPDLVAANQQIGVYSALWFWMNHNSYGNSGMLADHLTTDSFVKISENINGINQKTGLPNGEAMREQYYSRAIAAIYFNVNANEALKGIDGVDVQSLSGLLAAVQKLSTAEVVEITVTAGIKTTMRGVIVND